MDLRSKLIIKNRVKALRNVLKLFSKTSTLHYIYNARLDELVELRKALVKKRIKKCKKS